MTNQTQITETTVPGQHETSVYGIDAEGAIYLFSTSFGEWLPENLATKLARESRARGYRPTDNSGAWRKGENWMTRQRGRKVA